MPVANKRKREVYTAEQKISDDSTEYLEPRAETAEMAEVAEMVEMVEMVGCSHTVHNTRTRKKQKNIHTTHHPIR